MRPVIALAVSFLAAACASPTGASMPGASAAQRIAYYSVRIEKHPRVYAHHIGLAQAFLDRARETHDPAWLAKAAAASDASLALMETVEGLKMKARIAAFRHRFDEALGWADKAAALDAIDAADGEIIALRVEALMGLNRMDEARALLPEGAGETSDFHVAAALGHWLAAANRAEEAADAFSAASRIAERRNAATLAGWAETMAAGVFIDAGNAEAARPHLAAAEALDPQSRLHRAHVAELAMLEGRPEGALAMFETLVREAPDPEFHRRACLAARALGDDARAQRHFAAAEQMLIRVLDFGESFTLDELARLYVDGGASADEAARRARSHLAGG